MSENEPIIPTEFPGRPRRFRVHVISAAIAILAVIGHAFEAYANSIHEHMPSGQAVGVAIGVMIALGAFAYGIGWLAFYSCRRSQLCGNTFLCVIPLLANLAMIPHHAPH